MRSLEIKKDINLDMSKRIYDQCCNFSYGDKSRRSSNDYVAADMEEIYDFL